LLAPSLFGVVTFMLSPMLVVLRLPLHRWDLLGPIEFVGTLHVPGLASAAVGPGKNSPTQP
jgi:ABC-type sugar transport system permease subunit